MGATPVFRLCRIGAAGSVGDRNGPTVRLTSAIPCVISNTVRILATDPETVNHRKVRDQRAADTASSSTASPDAQPAARAGDADGAASFTTHLFVDGYRAG
ncbi:hypothetical protein BH23CHL2_BH23CHL2_01010 [soil metagenome]